MRLQQIYWAFEIKKPVFTGFSIFVVVMGGLEPSTYGLGIHRSDQLSYITILITCFLASPPFYDFDAVLSKAKRALLHKIVTLMRQKFDRE